MSYQLHRALSVLLANNDIDDTHDPTDIKSGVPQLGVIVQYKKGDGSTGGYPAFRVRWTLPGPGTMIDALHTVEDPMIDDDLPIAGTISYERRWPCAELTDATDATSIRVIDIPPGAIKVKVEPYENGDASHPGECAIWIGQV